MRATARLFATVARGSQYLTPGQPTGLTGLVTHGSPRPHLIVLYNSTLEQLKALPEASVYRQSAEALTRHRLTIISETIPPGFEEWKVRVQQQIKDSPEIFSKQGTASHFQVGGKTFIRRVRLEDKDDRELEWDGEEFGEHREGASSVAEKANQAREVGEGRGVEDLIMREIEHLEQEPALTIDQINDVETKIGAGLLEEIIVVAEGELQLVQQMSEHKVWEELAEKPVAGQWDYFQRDTNVGVTQAP